MYLHVDSYFLVDAMLETQNYCYDNFLMLYSCQKYCGSCWISFLCVDHGFNLENDENPVLCDALCPRKCQCLFYIKTYVFGLYGTKYEQPRNTEPWAHCWTARQRPSAAGQRPNSDSRLLPSGMFHVLSRIVLFPGINHVLGFYGILTYVDS